MPYVLILIEQIIINLHFLCAALAIAAALWYMELAKREQISTENKETDLVDKLINKTVIELTPPEEIKRVVFSGGGVKGVMYPGAYAALQETGLLNTITHVAGSSTGSLSAGFLAVGIESKAFRDAFIELDFEVLLGESIGFFSEHNIGSTIFSKTGQPLENWVRGLLLKSINHFFEQTNVTHNQELSALKRKLIDNIDAQFTFADLALLHNNFPKRFKQLTVTGISYPKGEFTVFDVKHYPTLDVAKAIRASASLPIAMIPCKIEGRYYMDGGFFDNIPSDYFDPNDQGGYLGNQKKEQTLVLAFGEGINNQSNAVFQALYGSRRDEFNEGDKPTLFRPGIMEQFQRDSLPYWLIGLRAPFISTQKKEEAYQRLRSDYPLRTIELRVGKLKTMDFSTARRDARVMWSLGYLDTLNYIINYNLADYSTFNQEKTVFNLVLSFMVIYQQLLKATHQNIEDNPLINNVQTLINNALDCNNAMQIKALQYIKQEVEFSPDTIEAVALSRSVETHYGSLSENELTSEIKKVTSEIKHPSVKGMRYRFLYNQNPMIFAEDNEHETCSISDIKSY